jgi:hypothetical protein
MKTKVRVTKKCTQQYSQLFVENLEFQIKQLILIQNEARTLARRGGSLSQLKKLLENPNNERQKFVRWAVIPYGLLEFMEMLHFNDEKK